MSAPLQVRRRTFLAVLGAALPGSKAIASGLFPETFVAPDPSDAPLAHALWYFYTTGSSTPATVYRTSALGAAHGHPVAADARGQFSPICFDRSRQYRGVLKTAAGIILCDIDPLDATIVERLGQNAGSNPMDIFKVRNRVAVRATPDEFPRRVSVSDFGARGDGRTVDTAAISKAILACGAGQTLYFPPGTYIIDNSDLHNRGASSTMPLPRGVNVLMDADAWLKRKSAEAVGVNFITATADNVIQVNIDGGEYLGSMMGPWAEAQSIGVYARGARNIKVVRSHFKNLNHGIRAEAASEWQVLSCEFYRHRGSGALFLSTAVGPVQNITLMSNCAEEMGDTAFAAATAQPGYEISGVDMTRNVARNTQLRTQGFALDIEGGFAFGRQFGHRISDNIVIQDLISPHGQGGVTMNLYTEDSEITDNVLLSGVLAVGDTGIAVPQTRNVRVHNNTVVGFRGNAIWADGAAKASIRWNVIRNCGDGSALIRSAVVLAYLKGSTDAVFSDNDMGWAPDYAHGGAAAAAVLANRGALDAAINGLVISNNRLSNPLGMGIVLRGYRGGFTVGRAAVDGNTIKGEVGSTVFGSFPIAATYAVNPSVQNNRIYETKYGIDLTNSSQVELNGNTLQNVATSATLATWVDLTNVVGANVRDNLFDTRVTTKIKRTGSTLLVFVGDQLRN